MGDGRQVKALRTVVTALSNIPPVVAGLLVFMLTNSDGPLGWLGIGFSITAMVVAQVMVITPLMASILFPAFLEMRGDFLETCKGIPLRTVKIYTLLFRECKYLCLSAVLIGFGRAMAEVAAVSLAGGDIKGQTRVLTTAIMTTTHQGEFTQAFVMAGILIAIVLFANILASRVKEKG